MKTFLSLLVASAAVSSLSAQTTLRLTLSSQVARDDAPVVLQLAKYGPVSSALVEVGGREVPCQLDDLDQDGRYDELAFVADLKAGQRQQAVVTLYNKGVARQYPARTFAEIVLRNPSVKQKNQHDIYLSEITVDKATANPYNVLHHHGVAFESELIALRIYMDKRQTIDLYGKFHKRLELQATQFYTQPEQKAEGYGDDVLWVGNTFGLGALRGWNGTEPTMLDDVAHRTQRILAQGPVRTIVEVEDRGWTMRPGDKPVNMTERYTLYAGHRDMDVDVTFNCDMTGREMATGVINVKNSEEITDHNGLRGCWGTDWPATDTANWKRETVGLAIYVPRQYRRQELPANHDNYGFVVAPQGRHLHYSLAYTSANENFGYHSKEEWAQWMKAWKQREESSITVTGLPQRKR
jgi:hypothetical protein